MKKKKKKVRWNKIKKYIFIIKNENFLYLSKRNNNGKCFYTLPLCNEEDIESKTGILVEKISDLNEESSLYLFRGYFKPINKEIEFEFINKKKIYNYLEDNKIEKELILKTIDKVKTIYDYTY